MHTYAEGLRKPGLIQSMNESMNILPFYTFIFKLVPIVADTVENRPMKEEIILEDFLF